VEYTPEELRKRKQGKGVWRLPPDYDGHARSPVPRFTTLTESQLKELAAYFKSWGEALIRVLVPGAHVFVASNPLVSFMVSDSLNAAGFQRRGEVIRLVRTMRGGDRPKGAHNNFPETSVIPRSLFEPWLLFRKPFEGRIQDCLYEWGTGALRRPSEGGPFPDVFASGVTPIAERNVGKHPTIKPQRFLRQIVRAVLPLGTGVVLDPFAGSGSTLAAANAVGYRSIGIEIVGEYCLIAKRAVPKLAALTFEDE
jgi:site-specific DNA-methyltransferase (adenine-specific)